MAEGAFVGLLLAFPLLGALTRRWSVLILALVGWPLFYAGLARGWWGYGVGDGWQYVAVAVTAVGVVSTALAVGLARWLRPPPRRLGPGVV